mgnify:CR=1 FL=1
MIMEKNKSMYALLAAVGVLIGGSIWFACSTDDEIEDFNLEPTKTKKRIPTRAELASMESPSVQELIMLENNRYYVWISQEDANELGISSALYQQAVEQVAEENYFISEMEREAVLDGKRFIYNDDYYVNSIHKMMRLTTDPEIQRLPHGQITTSNDSLDWDTPRAASDITRIYATCTNNNNPSAIQYVMIHTTHTTKMEKFYGNSSKTITLEELNTSIMVGYRTKDNSGGKCIWFGQL